jgi:hypothetical protein
MDRSETSYREKDRASPWRGVAVLAGMLLAAGAIAPAYSATLTTKNEVKKVVKKQILKAGSKRFIEEEELTRWGPVGLNVGSAMGVAEVGPFSFSAHCDELDLAGDGPPLEERGRILVISHQDNSLIESDEEGDDDFDALEVAVWASETADDPGVQEVNSEDNDDARAASPTGTRLVSTSNTIVLSHAGSDCVFSGSILELP